MSMVRLFAVVAVLVAGCGDRALEMPGASADVAAPDMARPVASVAAPDMAKDCGGEGQRCCDTPAAAPNSFGTCAAGLGCFHSWANGVVYACGACGQIGQQCCPGENRCDRGHCTFTEGADPQPIECVE